MVRPREFAAMKLIRETAEQDARQRIQREPEDEDLSPLDTFLRDNPDSATWTAAQARKVLERTAKMAVRARRRVRQ